MLGPSDRFRPRSVPATPDLPQQAGARRRTIRSSKLGRGRPGRSNVRAPLQGRRAPLAAVDPAFWRGELERPLVEAQWRKGSATKPQAQRILMMVQTTLVQGASFPYFGFKSYRLSISGLPPACLRSISCAPLPRLCSIALRRSVSEPLPAPRLEWFARSRPAAGARFPRHAMGPALAGIIPRRAGDGWPPSPEPRAGAAAHG